jgi:HTH-type transcriptional regulator/antitoxin HigA
MNLLRQAEIRPLRSDADHAAALNEVVQLMDAEPGSPEADRLEVLGALIVAYEEMHHTIPPPHPIEAIKYHMESRGITRRDLEPVLGGRGRVSEILNLRRPLTLPMIQRLVRLGIPADSLVTPYPLSEPRKKRDAAASTGS